MLHSAAQLSALSVSWRLLWQRLAVVYCLFVTSAEVYVPCSTATLKELCTPCLRRGTKTIKYLEENVKAFQVGQQEDCMDPGSCIA